MNQEEFQEKVEKGLKKLNQEQTVQFAWCCAMRSLPFLGGNGNFNFWEKINIQQHLYTIFQTLDLIRSRKVIYNKNILIASKAVRIHTSDLFINRIDTYASWASLAERNVSACAAKATIDAIYSAIDYVVTIEKSFFKTELKKVVDIAIAAFRAANTYATIEIMKPMSARGFKNIISFDRIILEDIEIIGSSNEKFSLFSNFQYEKIWDNFQKALENENCRYWIRLYKYFFFNKLYKDNLGLDRRLNVPKEIREQGAAAVANYLEELEKGATRLNEARIIILGDKGCGKTSIARKLINARAPMPTEDDSTAGVNTFIWKLEDENINVRIWDFAGHTVIHAVHQFFLSERCLYLMVHNSRTENNSRLNYWLDHMKNYGGENSKAIILVNKRDDHRVEIPVNNLTANYPIAGNYNFSIKDDTGELEKFRKDIAKFIKENPSWEKQQLPVNYYQVKEELEAIFDKSERWGGREHISRNEFDQIAKIHKVKDADQLLKDLHYLGISLWYQDMDEFDTLVLNPEWISHGVYKIINWVSNEKRHSLTLGDFNTVFSDDLNRYPAEKHPFLFRLMKRYELAYETSRGNELIIPHLLNEDRPATLPDFPVGDSLMLRYKAEQLLPPNTISRFIVRHNQQIKKNRQYYFVWRYGVILELENSIALVIEEDRTISVSVKGNGKSQFLSTLRDTLNEIFKSYKSKTPELQYRVERFGQIPDELENKYPLWLPDQKILSHYRKAKPYYDDATEQEIYLAFTVNNYDIKAENLISGGEGHKIVNTTIHNNLEEHYNYMIYQQPNYNIKDEIQQAIQDLMSQKNTEIIKEIEEGISAAFEEATGSIDQKLNQIYKDLQKTDNVGMKIKLAVPLLNLIGIQLETEFDLKNWATQMYNEHKKEIFNTIANARSRDLGAK